MGSAYTDNNKFEKIGTGEQAGTWGTTTNLNFDMIDRAINGVKSIGLTGTSSSLTTSDGTLTDGLFKVLQFTGSLSSLHTITISPNDVEKLYFINNNCGASVKFTQGSGGDVTIENASTAIIFCDGAGGSAKVTKIETGSDAFTTDVTIKTDDGALLTLQTGDTTITDGDVLGALQFQAPSESDGDGDASSDSIKVAASIVAEAEGTFADDNNATSLVFNTSSSAVAGGAGDGGRMTLNSSGRLSIKAMATADNTRAVLALEAGDTDIAVDDELGKIVFTAPDEGTETDSRLVAGAIAAVSEGDFAADNNATKLSFMTGASEAASEKMLLSSVGVLSIPADGSTTTNGVHVGTGSDLKIYHDGSNSYVNDTGTGSLILKGSVIKLESSADTANMINATAAGDVKLYYNGGVRVTTSAAGASINGTLTATEVTATSDERLKSDIKTIDNALDKVMNMRGVSFTKQAERGIGVIAQEVEKIIPEVVTDGEYKSVAYGNMVGVLIEAIKEQQKQIDELKKDK
mgnify:FL=1